MDSQCTRAFTHTHSIKQGSVLTVSADRSSIYCPDQTSMDQPSTNHQQPKFVLDVVHQGSRSRAAGVFEEHVRPLLDGMVDGSDNDKDACVVSFGKASETNRLIEVPTGREQGNAVPLSLCLLFPLHVRPFSRSSQHVHGSMLTGIVARAVAELLNVRQFLASDDASLTISWYQMKAEAPESIVDVLNAAASAGLGAGAGMSGLGLRDADDGHGVLVPGLWEVEVKSAQDAQNIIQQVRDNVVCRQLASETRHSVLTLHLRGIWGASALVHTRGPLQNVDVGRVARLSFICLGPLLDEPSGGPLSPSSAMLPSWSSPTMQWVQIISNLLTTMEARHPSPHFKRSRLATLLRDALSGVLRTSWLCVLDPSLVNAPLSLASLRFAQQIKSVRDVYVAPIGASNAIASSPVRQRALPMRRPPQPPVTEVAEVSKINSSPSTSYGGAEDTDAPPEALMEGGAQQPASDSVTGASSSVLATVDDDTARFIDQLKETCVQLQCERDALLQSSSMGNDSLTSKERQRLRKAERDAKDHDM